MSLYRKAFLIWWTALALFIAIFICVNWDMVPGGNQAIIGFMVMIFALGSWIPSAAFNLLWPQYSQG